MKYKKFKTLIFSISLFSWLILTSLSSVLIIINTYSSYISNFNDINTLLDNTYNRIIVAKDEIGYEMFKVSIFKIMGFIYSGSYSKGSKSALAPPHWTPFRADFQSKP